MADNTTLNVGAGGDVIASDDIAGVKHQRVKVEFGTDGSAVDVDASNPLPVTTASLPLPVGAATETTLGNVLTTSDFDAKTGSLTETPPATDTASSGLNGRLQRIAQRITSLIALLPAALTGTGNLKTALVESTATVTVTGTVAATNANLDAALSTLLTTTDFDGKVGSLVETAPASDTASSGLNGRLQRIAQRLTSLIALLPAALTGSGNLKVAIVESTATVTSIAAGDVASGSTDSGNPVKIGGVGKTAAPTAVTDGQRVNALFDKIGRQIHARTLRELVTRATTAITGNTETTILAAIAATFLDVTHLSITNSSATAVTVTIRDTTGGSAMAVYDIPANGGIVLHFDPAMMQTTVNTNWTAQVSSAVSTIHINVVAMKST